ncbi:MAG: hypothetical protein JF614_31895 [Acidobacteria bacterium]|nr:hypothetical protein [Acidobacteriota bacterium]
MRVRELLTAAEAREHGRRIGEQMEALRLQLLGVECSLPESPGPHGLSDEEMEAVTEVRSVILCVVKDAVRPAIDDLRGLAAPPAAARSGEDKP